ncbi:MAG: class II aldolase/adducin family protein [Synergistes sp.]|nr:class II aldolase/adducin family protein [Synergistes sp.]
MKYEDIRNEIISCAQRLRKCGLIYGTAGNFSVRTPDGFIITPSGMDYSVLTPEDLPELTLDAQILEGTRTPSVEKNMHAAIYRARADVCAAVHTHSIYATAAASLRRALPPITDGQAVTFGGAVPVSLYAPIGTKELAANVTAALSGGSAVLIANHGVLCVGSTLAEAASRCEMLEIYAKIFFTAQLAGGAVALTEEEARTEAAYAARIYGQR